MVATTALSYQMMLEEKFMAAMINAEQRGAYFIAANYAIIHCHFLGIDNLPSKPLPTNKQDRQEIVDQWLDYYFKLMDAIGKHAQETLIAVRAKYGKKTGIPTK